MAVTVMVTWISMNLVSALVLRGSRFLSRLSPKRWHRVEWELEGSCICQAVIISYWGRAMGATIARETLP
jgi:hypothetical protein